MFLQGNVGTAAYLNVFGSIFRVLKELKRQGYDVGDVPASEADLIQSVLQVRGRAGQDREVGRTVTALQPPYALRSYVDDVLMDLLHPLDAVLCRTRRPSSTHPT
jgi:cobalamin biosynthesis Mg chelatase CobN